MEVELKFISLEEFRNVDEISQNKAIFTFYGFNVADFVDLDQQLVFMMKVECLENYIGSKIEAEDVWKRKEKIYETATLGKIFKAFKKSYVIDKKLEELFNDVILKRNILVHKYMQNTQQFDDLEMRFEIYEDMLGVSWILTDFFSKIRKKKFLAKRQYNGRFEVAYSGGIDRTWE